MFLSFHNRIKIALITIIWSNGKSILWVYNQSSAFMLCVFNFLIVFYLLYISVLTACMSV